MTDKEREVLEKLLAARPKEQTAEEKRAYHKAYNKAYKRTKEGMIAQIYGSMKSNSKKRGHALPSFSKEWLEDWLLLSPKFHRLYELWKVSGYKSTYKPSVDRKDDTIGYTEFNIQLMTWAENNAKESKAKSKAVLQYTKDNEFITEHESGQAAERATGINTSNISHCCSGCYQSAGGFIWRYKDA